MEDLTVKINGKEYNARVEETEDGKILVHCNGEVYEIETTKNKEAEIFNRVKKQEFEEKGKSVVTSPLPGIIYEVKVKKGQSVKEGQLLLKIVAMKMENDINSPISGKIKLIKVKKNQKVNKDDILVVIE